MRNQQGKPAGFNSSELHPFMQKLLGEYRSYRDAEADTGMSKSTLHRYSKNPPAYIELLKQDAEAFGLTPQEWLGGWLDSRQ